MVIDNVANEKNQAMGYPYIRVVDLTPEQFEELCKRCIYRAGSLAVLVGAFGVVAVWVMFALMFAGLR